MLLLQRMEKGDLAKEEAERLAMEGLKRKEEVSQKAVRLLGEWESQDRSATQLQGTVEKLKTTVTKYENDLVTLKARARTAASTRKINEQLAKVDSSGTIAMLEKMKAKVEEDESLAQAYGSMAAVDTSIDDEISVALTKGTAHPSVGALADLKAKMGISG